MNTRTLLLSTLLLTSGSALWGQSYAVYVETGLLQNAQGTAVAYNIPDLNGRVINGYVTVVDAAFSYEGIDPLGPTESGLNAITSQLSWTPMVDGGPLDPLGRILLSTPGAPDLLPIGIGQKPLVLFTDGTPNDLTVPTQVALLEGAPFTFVLENRALSLGNGALTVIVGTSSVQLVNLIEDGENTWWGGFEIETRGGLYVDTGEWLGELEVSLRPWTLSSRNDGWFFINEQVAASGGGWIFVASVENLLLQEAEGNGDWAYSHTLNEWLYVVEETLSNGSGWAYSL